jgi:hypothetical protein
MYTLDGLVKGRLVCQQNKLFFFFVHSPKHGHVQFDAKRVPYHQPLIWKHLHELRELPTIGVSAPNFTTSTASLQGYLFLGNSGQVPASTAVAFSAYDDNKKTEDSQTSCRRTKASPVLVVALPSYPANKLLSPQSRLCAVVYPFPQFYQNYRPPSFYV